ALPPDGTRHEETILDAWIDRLLRGEPLEDILGTPAMRSIDLLPMLRMANAIVRWPRDPVPADVRHHAMNAILREIEAARFRTARYAPVRAAETEPRAEPEAPQRVKRTPGSRRGLPRPRAVVGVGAAIAVHTVNPQLEGYACRAAAVRAAGVRSAAVRGACSEGRQREYASPSTPIAHVPIDTTWGNVIQSRMM